MQFEIDCRKIVAKRWLIECVESFVVDFDVDISTSECYAKKTFNQSVNNRMMQTEFDDAIICYDTNICNIRKMNWLARRNCWLNTTRVKTLWLWNNHLVI